uniref:Uncharacterized protein n=1 Tax=Ditylenchus dipsaci TaxID=166011 RepID=A0A915DYW2_9BILA
MDPGSTKKRDVPSARLLAVERLSVKLPKLHDYDPAIHRTESWTRSLKYGCMFDLIVQISENADTGRIICKIAGCGATFMISSKSAK